MSIVDKKSFCSFVQTINWRPNTCSRYEREYVLADFRTLGSLSCILTHVIHFYSVFIGQQSHVLAVPHGYHEAEFTRRECAALLRGNRNDYEGPRRCWVYVRTVYAFRASAVYRPLYGPRARFGSEGALTSEERVLNVEEITRWRAHRSLSSLMPRDRRRYATRASLVSKSQDFSRPVGETTGSRMGVRVTWA